MGGAEETIVGLEDRNKTCITTRSKLWRMINAVSMCDYYPEINVISKNGDIAPEIL